MAKQQGKPWQVSMTNGLINVFFFHKQESWEHIFKGVNHAFLCQYKKNKINMWQIKVITEREKVLVYVALPEPENTLGQ